MSTQAQTATPAPEAFDAFATLGLGHRLDLSEAEIEGAWQELSRRLHPDGEGGDAERAAAVNRARGILGSASGRLRHWLERRGIPVPRQVPVAADLMDAFGETGRIFQAADDLLRRRSSATTALGRALLAEESFALQQRLQELLRSLQQQRRAAADAFPDIESAARSGDSAPALAALGRLGFLEKWEAQGQARLLAFLTD